MLARPNTCAPAPLHRAHPHLASLLAAAAVALGLAGPSLGQEQPPTQQRLAPTVRIARLPAPALPALSPHLIEPFLAEPQVLEEAQFQRAPRIVAAPDGRVLITQGDRAYVRGPAGFARDAASSGSTGSGFGIFRSGRTVHDPATGAVLGFEARLVGRARLLRPETTQSDAASGESLPVPALVGIVAAREEIRAGDRLLPEPARELQSYLPRPPETPIEGARVAALYGDAIGMAGQNQVVVINKGRADGLENGHVLAVIRSGARASDRTQSGEPQAIRLPDERNGLVMVFRPYERLSYALILGGTEGVKVGDRLVPPR